MALPDIFNNFSEKSTVQLQDEFRDFLMPDEAVTYGFKLMRDAVLFTDKRIVFLDKQGATGQQITVESIFLLNLIGVTVQTAGFGISESQLTIVYMQAPFPMSHSPALATKTLEFQKKCDIRGLYTTLEEVAYSNCLRLNKA